MPITERELLAQYGEAATAGNAALFIGAGLSAGAGLPGWSQLLEEPLAQAAIPKSLTDLPLAAEYIVQALPGGRDALEHHILTKLSADRGEPPKGQRGVPELRINIIGQPNITYLL